MATIINNPGTATSDSGNTGLIVGLVVLLFVILGLFYFGTGYFRGSRSTAAPTIQNNTQDSNPAPQGGTQINVPDKIDVNVQGK